MVDAEACPLDLASPTVEADDLSGVYHCADIRGDLGEVDKAHACINARIKINVDTLSRTEVGSGEFAAASQVRSAWGQGNIDPKTIDHSHTHVFCSRDVQASIQHLLRLSR